MTSRPDPKFGQSKFKMKSLTKWNFCWKFWFSPFNLCCCWVKTTKKEAWYTKELNHFNASQIAGKKISFLTYFVMKTETVGHIKWDCGINWDSQLTGKFLKGSKTRSAACRQSRGGYRRSEVKVCTTSSQSLWHCPNLKFDIETWNELLFWWRELSLKDKTEGFTTKCITERPIMSGGRLLRVPLELPRFAGHHMTVGEIMRALQAKKHSSMFTRSSACSKDSNSATQSQMRYLYLKDTFDFLNWEHPFSWISQNLAIQNEILRSKIKIIHISFIWIKIKEIWRYTKNRDVAKDEQNRVFTGARWVR